MTSAFKERRLFSAERIISSTVPIFTLVARVTLSRMPASALPTIRSFSPPMYRAAVST